MSYEYVAISAAEIPNSVAPAFQHLVTTYASEVNKTVTVWRAVPDTLLDFCPHPKTNTIRTIMVHQLLSERRFFSEFVGIEEPAVEELLPRAEKPVVQEYIDKYVLLALKRLPQFARGSMAWWLEERDFFGERRQRIWVYWRRVLHTCHHRTQVQSWLRLAGHEPVPAIYGPSGDAKSKNDDPTYSLEAANRGSKSARR